MWDRNVKARRGWNHTSLERFDSPCPEAAGIFVYGEPMLGEASHGVVVSVNKPKTERAMDDD